jgi:NAD(P)-dependent dehydrogenase (short-subunit alcohol dehydrogenase family)
VLVTGASTGIGEAVARDLAAKGHPVFAGVRTADDAERLRGPDLTPVTLDVTDADQVRAVAGQVEAEVGGEGLLGLVNNAGIARGGPLEFLPVDEWRDQLEVNVVGQVAVTKALLPLIRTGNGRIVFIGSIGGRVGSPLMGPYNASKFAIEGLAEALRLELAPWGTRVAVVEPGAVRTDIWSKARTTTARLEDELPPEAMALYGDAMDDIRKGIERNDEGGVAPQKVADAVHHALTAKRPRHRYVVGPDARAAAVLNRLLPDRAKHVVLAKAASR